MELMEDLHMQGIKPRFSVAKKIEERRKRESQIPLTTEEQRFLARNGSMNYTGEKKEVNFAELNRQQDERDAERIAQFSQ